MVINSLIKAVVCNPIKQECMTMMLMVIMIINGDSYYNQIGGRGGGACNCVISTVEPPCTTPTDPHWPRPHL